MTSAGFEETGLPARWAVSGSFQALLLLVGSIAAAEPPPLEAFFAAPTFQSPRLSPNGENLAVIHHEKGRQLVLVRSLEGGKLTPIARFDDPEFRLSRLMWANDERLLVSGQQSVRWFGGRKPRATRLFGINRDGTRLRPLGKKWSELGSVVYQDNFVHSLPDDPRHVLLQVQMPRRRSPGVYRLDVYDGGLERIVNPKHHIYRWFADPSGSIRVGFGVDPPELRLVARSGAEDDFEEIANYHITRGEGLSVLGFTKDPDKLLVSARRPHPGDLKGDRIAIWEYSLTTREIGALVLAHDVVDVEGTLVYDPETEQPVAIEYWIDGLEYHFLDPKHAALQRGIDHALPNRTNRIVGRAKKGRIVLVHSSAPDRPPETYVVMRDEGEAYRLFSDHSELEGVALGRPRPIQYTARDGVVIHGYLTLPPGSDGRSLPAVLLPHGGPTARDTLRFDREVLFLASRGYAVLQMNFRGSSGYGYAHEAAGYKRWGLEMQDDISDGALWLVEQGIADPERIGIYGASYGGYAALMAAVKTPTLFRCAASYAGVFDLNAEVHHDSGYVGGELIEELVGDDRRKRRAASPRYAADKVQIPILLGHGKDDPNVHMDQSRNMAKALRKAGKQVELVLYEDEVHGWEVEAAALDFARRLERFFATHLAPKEAGEAAPREKAAYGGRRSRSGGDWSHSGVLGYCEGPHRDRCQLGGFSAFSPFSSSRALARMPSSCAAAATSSSSRRASCGRPYFSAAIPSARA